MNTFNKVCAAFMAAVMLCLVQPHGATIIVRGPVVAAAAAPTYLINQNFEGTGYDNSETWTEAGTVDEDYTPALVGSQSAKLNSSYANLTSPTFSGQTDVWAYARIKPIDYWHTNAAPFVMFAIRDSSNNILAAVSTEYVSGGTEPNNVYIQANGSEGSASATQVERATEWHFWIHFVSGGTCAIYGSTTGTRPSSDGSGVIYLTKTGGSGTATNVNIAARTDNYLVIDRVLVSASEIGSNP